MIKGRFEIIRPSRIRGWAVNTDRTKERLRVEVLFGGKPVAEGVANQMRKDLVKAGIGDGHHGFEIDVAGELPPNDTSIQVRARGNDGDPQPLGLTRKAAVSGKSAPTPDEELKFAGTAADAEQRPVFVLGAERSGTTAMTVALKRTGRFEGPTEGHVFNLLGPLQQCVDAHYLANAGHRRSKTLIRQVPPSYLRDSLNQVFADLARRLFEGRHWLDKTPGPEMVACAPLVRALWPNARFIYMKRRGIENVASQVRKFVAHTFEDHCVNWAASMERWEAVRDQLASAAIEIDQRFMAQNPTVVADEVGALLGFTPEERQRFLDSLLEDHPQQTGTAIGELETLDALDWTEQQRAKFRKICEPVMLRQGYDLANGYFAPGHEHRGMLRI